MSALVDSLSTQLGLPMWIIVIALVWILAWKGVALWKAARNNHIIWFIALLLVQTFGLFEILYIFLFSKIDLNDLSSSKKNANKIQKTSNGKVSK